MGTARARLARSETTSGGVHDAAVDVPELLQPEEGGGVRGVFEHERGALVNGDGARQAGLVGCVASVQAPGSKAHLVGGFFRHSFQDTISTAGETLRLCTGLRGQLRRWAS